MPFEIAIDYNFILTLVTRPFFSLIWFYFSHGGWVIFLIIIFWAAIKLINFKNKQKRKKQIKYIFLSVDVPRNNENGPEVTERLFAHLATAGSTGGLDTPDFGSKIKPTFSFEIISDSGKIEFLVRTPADYRDLLESAFYAEYPNAEIREVEDYAQEAPDIFPDPEYDIWGAEIILYNKDVYPIRTYPAFEHSLSGEFRDPMSNFLEVFNRVKKGEKIWVQIIISFAGLSWKKRGERLVDQLIGKKAKNESGGISGLLGNLVRWGFGGLSDIIYEIFSGGDQIGEGEKKAAKEAPPSLISYLSPGEKDKVSAVEKKISKIGFKTKIRFIYLAEKDVFDTHRAVPGILGALNQFNTLDMNGFKPDKFVKTQPSPLDFFPVKKMNKMKREIMKGYKSRSTSRGSNPYILNIEELATIYHFPVVSVEAPLVKKTGSRHGEPPFSLPTKDSF